MLHINEMTLNLKKLNLIFQIYHQMFLLKSLLYGVYFLMFKTFSYCILWLGEETWNLQSLKPLTGQKKYCGIQKGVCW